jgi:hypothetical protein
MICLGSPLAPEVVMRRFFHPAQLSGKLELSIPAEIVVAVIRPSVAYRKHLATNGAVELPYQSLTVTRLYDGG